MPTKAATHGPRTASSTQAATPGPRAAVPTKAATYGPETALPAPAVTSWPKPALQAPAITPHTRAPVTPGPASPTPQASPGAPKPATAVPAGPGSGPSAPALTLGPGPTLPAPEVTTDSILYPCSGPPGPVCEPRSLTPIFADHRRCGCAGRGRGPSPCHLRCAVRLAGGLLQAGRAVGSWKLRLSRGRSPLQGCHQAEACPRQEERRGPAAASHLPATAPPPCPLLCDAHAPGRGDTATP